MEHQNSLHSHLLLLFNAHCLTLTVVINDSICSLTARMDPSLGGPVNTQVTPRSEYHVQSTVVAQVSDLRLTQWSQDSARARAVGDQKEVILPMSYGNTQSVGDYNSVLGPSIRLSIE